MPSVEGVAQGWPGLLVHHSGWGADLYYAIQRLRPALAEILGQGTGPWQPRTGGRRNSRGIRGYNAIMVTSS